MKKTLILICLSTLLFGCEDNNLSHVSLVSRVKRFVSTVYRIKSPNGFAGIHDYMQENYGATITTINMIKPSFYVGLSSGLGTSYELLNPISKYYVREYKSEVINMVNLAEVTTIDFYHDPNTVGFFPKLAVQGLYNEIEPNQSEAKIKYNNEVANAFKGAITDFVEINIVAKNTEGVTQNFILKPSVVEVECTPKTQTQAFVYNEEISQTYIGINFMESNHCTIQMEFNVANTKRVESPRQ